MKETIKLPWWEPIFCNTKVLPEENIEMKEKILEMLKEYDIISYETKAKPLTLTIKLKQQFIPYRNKIKCKYCHEYIYLDRPEHAEKFELNICNRCKCKGVTK